MEPDVKTLPCGCVEETMNDKAPFLLKICDTHQKKEGFQGSLDSLLQNKLLLILLSLALLGLGIFAYVYFTGMKIPTLDLFGDLFSSAGESNGSSSS
jgi:hypothetical protein